MNVPLNSSRIREILHRSLNVIGLLAASGELTERLGMLVEECTECYRKGGKILLCGNGGSAADAQHIAAELSGRYLKDRPPLDAEALHVNTSYLTAVANDYGYEEVFARMVEARGRAGDVLLAFSTSGNSSNVVRAAQKAQDQGMLVAAFTGENGGRLAQLADLLLNVPSTETARIQEGHILLGHALCELIEENLYPAGE